MASSSEDVYYSDITFGKILGQGGFGTVHLATVNKPYNGPEKVAVKTVHALQLREEEVSILQDLDHPHVVNLYHYIQEGPFKLLVFEYAPNGTVTDYLKKNAPLPDDLILKWLREAAVALQYLHSRNVLHRDIKGSNCLIFSDRLLKLSDFGLARLIDRTMTTSSAKGTYRYMAPEIHSENHFSFWSDTFAYGMLGLEIISGKEPFHDLQWQSIVFQVTKNKLKPKMPQRAPSVVANLLRHCGEYYPRDRPSADEIVATLFSIDQGLTSSSTNDEQHDGRTGMGANYVYVALPQKSCDDSSTNNSNEDSQESLHHVEKASVSQNEESLYQTEESGSQKEESSSKNKESPSSNEELSSQMEELSLSRDTDSVKAPNCDGKNSKGKLSKEKDKTNRFTGGTVYPRADSCTTVTGTIHSGADRIPAGTVRSRAYSCPAGTVHSSVYKDNWSVQKKTALGQTCEPEYAVHIEEDHDTIDGGNHPDEIKQTESLSKKQLRNDVARSKPIGSDVSGCKLILEFGEEGDNEGQFRQAKDVAVCPNGEIVVSEYEHEKVYLFRNNGSYKYTLKSHATNPVSKLLYPEKVAVTPENKIIVADQSQYVKVFKNYSFHGSLSAVAPLSNKAKITGTSGVAISPSGDILIGDIRRKVITIHTKRTKPKVSEIAVPIRPVYISANNQNHIVLSDWKEEKVVAISKGKVLFTIAEFIVDGSAGSPEGVSYDSQGHLYVVTMKKDTSGKFNTLVNTGHIHQYDQNGKFLKCVARDLYRPFGIDISKDGLLAVANSKSVLIYSI